MLHTTYNEVGGGARQCARAVIYGGDSLDQGKTLSGYIYDYGLKDNLNYIWPFVTSIQADGDELVRCCEILGRRLPDKRVYTFIGDTTKEIAINWY